MFSVFSPKRLAIDLGTVNLLVWTKQSGVVVNQPTVVAVDPKLHKILAVGFEAREMLGKEPKGIEARRPVQGGSIVHYQVTEALLRKSIEKAVGGVSLSKHQIVISVPAGVTSVEQRAVVQALTAVGAGEVFLIPEPVAAAIGAKLPVSSTEGSMIVNLGGGTAEIAVISSNGIVEVSSVRNSGDMINQEIIKYMKKKHNLMIGEQMAEHVKCTVATAQPLPELRLVEAKGRDLSTGLPNSVQVNSEELIPVVRQVLNKIVYEVKEVLKRVPPELSADISENGIAMSGGTSMLRKIDDYFSGILTLPVYVVEDPLRCVVRGLAMISEDMDNYRRLSLLRE